MIRNKQKKQMISNKINTKRNNKKQNGMKPK